MKLIWTYNSYPILYSASYILNIGLSYASFKGNRASLLKPSEDPNDPASAGVITKSTKSEIAYLEEKYNEWVSQVNELADKKIELTNNIKLKQNNKELMRKARYASEGNDSMGKNIIPDKGTSFGLTTMIIVFLITFSIGMYYGSS